MKSFRGIMVIAAVLTALVFASVAQAGTIGTMGTCYFDTKGNIVWCSE